MHQFECGACVDVDLIVGAATGADISPVGERRSEALAARQHEAADLVDRFGEVGVEGDPPLSFGGQQFVEACLDPIGDRSEAGWGGSRHLVAGYCCVGCPAPTCVVRWIRWGCPPARVRVAGWAH